MAYEVDDSAAKRLRLAADVAQDYGDRSVQCAVQDLFELTDEVFEGRTERDLLRDALQELFSATIFWVQNTAVAPMPSGAPPRRYLSKTHEKAMKVLKELYGEDWRGER